MYASDVVVSGEGVSVRLIDYYRVMDNQEMSLLSQQLNELRKKETTISDSMAAWMAGFEFPAPIGPDTGSDVVNSLICPTCGTANSPDATLCIKCSTKLEKPKDPKPPEKDAKMHLPRPRRNWPSRS